MKSQGTWAVLVAGVVACSAPAFAQTNSAESRAQAALINTQLGMEYMRQGKLQAARDKIEKALDQNPRTAQTQMAAGFLYDRLADDRKAKSHFEQAVKLADGDPDVLNNAAVYFCRKNERKLGEKYFLQAASSPLYQTPEIAYANAGRCARADGRVEDAEQYYRKALAFKPDQPEALLQLADMYQETDRSAQARPFLQRYLAAAPATSAALWLGYRIERSLGDSAAAEEYAQRIKMEFASSAETRSLLEAERDAQ
jgi:type IV pilus assembly protein PilF